MSLNKFLIILTLTVCISCSSNKESASISKGDYGELLVKLDLIDTLSEHLKMSRFFAPQVKAIILETQNDAMIGQIDKIHVHNDQILVLDRFIAKGIFVFDTEGHFLFKVGKEGKAVGDYLKLGDFTVDENNDKILLLDVGKQSILSFDARSGKYIANSNVSISVDQDYTSNSIEWIDGELYTDVYCYNDNINAPLLRKIDPLSGKEKSVYDNLAKQNKRSHRKLLSQSPFKRYNANTVLFFHPFMNTVFKVSSTEVTPLVTISSNNIFTVEELNKINMNDPLDDFSMNRIIMNRISGVECCYIFNEELFVHYLQGTSPNSLLVSRTNETGIRTSYLIDDLAYKQEYRVFFNPMFASKHGVYSVCSGFYMEKLIQAIANNGLNDSISNKEQLIQINEQSNPVLFFYEYK